MTLYVLHGYRNTNVKEAQRNNYKGRQRPVREQNVAKCPAVGRSVRWDNEAIESFIKVGKNLAVDSSISLHELDIQLSIQRVLNLPEKRKLMSACLPTCLAYILHRN